MGCVAGIAQVTRCGYCRPAFDIPIWSGLKGRLTSCGAALLDLFGLRGGSQALARYNRQLIGDEFALVAIFNDTAI